MKLQNKGILRKLLKEAEGTTASLDDYYMTYDGDWGICQSNVMSEYSDCFLTFRPTIKDLGYQVDIMHDSETKDEIISDIFRTIDRTLSRIAKGLELSQDSKTSTETLEKLADDEYVSVRKSVTQNPNTPSSILAILANDEYLSVREYVAQNPNTSTETLKSLADDVFVSVIEIAKENLSKRLLDNQSTDELIEELDDDFLDTFHEKFEVDNTSKQEDDDSHDR